MVIGIDTVLVTFAIGSIGAVGGLMFKFSSSMTKHELRHTAEERAVDDLLAWKSELKKTLDELLSNDRDINAAIHQLQLDLSDQYVKKSDLERIKDRVKILEETCERRKL